jgi:predicted transcriptional regulator
MGLREDKHRRGRYDLWASILDLLFKEESTLNGIKDATRLNRKRLKHHIDDMVSLGLIQSERSRRFVTYSITELGVQHLEGYKRILTGSLTKEDHHGDF